MKTRRPVSIALGAALLLSSWGPGAASALAQQAVGRIGSVSSVLQMRVPAAIAAPTALLTPLAPLPALPVSAIVNNAAPAPIPVAEPARAVVDAAAKPSIVQAVEPAPAEAYGRAAAEDFARRMTGEGLVSGKGGAYILAALAPGVDSKAQTPASKLKGPRASKRIGAWALERGLTQSQTSLHLSRPYDILVLNPDSKALADPKLYARLSDGEARVTLAEDVAPAPVLAKSERRFRAIVLGGAAAELPRMESADSLRLETVLKKLDSLNLLATRLVARGGSFDNAQESGAWSDLVDRAQRLRADNTLQAKEIFEDGVRKLWRQIVSQRLKGMGVSELIEGIYGGLSDRGSAFLSFGPDDHGVASWEKLLRYWEAADGGQFRVTRVDLDNGGHMLIMRKIEARVGLWLRPIQGGRLATSIANASFSKEGRAAARQALVDAGLGAQVELLGKLEVIVRHVFGADVGRQEIYVTVPRRNANAIRKFVSPTTEVLSSQSNFQPHLMDVGEIHNVKPVFQAGITGADGHIFWIDTGADASHEDFGGRLDVIDMVDEGPEDWLGHGTHNAGISISGNANFLGMAKAALGTMAKVFSRDQSGATDGDIMGAAVAAMKHAIDVISLSFGSRGSSGDNLADFFSELTKHKNAAGEYPIVTASAGNSGPFDFTLSQPAAGVNVSDVAAAAKSKDDGVPEITLFSGGGPDIDRRFTIKRLRFKPDFTGIGGDVVTVPGSDNVYQFGVFSARSKDAPRSPSDLSDGKHTGMSGTSMSNPAVAAIALLVKQAMRVYGTMTPFIAENLPFVVKAVLMRSARDMGIPIWRQGAGLVDAWAAVSLVAQGGTRGVGGGIKSLWSRVSGTAPVVGEGAWDWIVRLKAVEDAEDRVYRESELAKSQGGDVQKSFNTAGAIELPRLLVALKDPVWLVRVRAAAVLMNLKSPTSQEALAEAGMHDADARVRQSAFLALGEMRSSALDLQLQKAADGELWDVGVYAAYALARRGDRSALGRAVKELMNTDKRARLTSAWILGQIRDLATTVESESLSARVRDRAERGNIRHYSAAALSNLADAAPESFSDRVVADLLDSAGPENLALTHTIGKVFPAALRSKDFVARLRGPSLKRIVSDFVIKNRDALGKPGSLNELVALLARAADIPLDAPTALMDPTGAGVLGVDETIGPVDMFVVPPSGSAAQSGLDEATLARFETTARASLPLSGGVWLSVPEHKIYALTIALKRRGWSVRRALPYYPLSNAPAEAGGLTLDLGDGSVRTAIPAGSDLSLVRVRASGGVSEIRVMAELERVAAARGKGPTVVALTLGAPMDARGTPLSATIDRLVAAGVGVVVGAGNAGPNPGTVFSSGDSGLAVVVAAASGAGLQFYSARGTPQEPRVTWTDLVDDLQPGEMIAAAATAAAGAVTDVLAAAPRAAPAKALGTAVAAERTAAKLAALAGALTSGLAAKGLPLPDGWFPYLTSLVKSSAILMPSLGAEEVGAGLFDLQRALDLLGERLRDPEMLVREAAAMAREVRLRASQPSAAAPAGLFRRSLRGAWGWTPFPVGPAALKLTARFTTDNH